MRAVVPSHWRRALSLLPPRRAGHDVPPGDLVARGFFSGPLVGWRHGTLRATVLRDGGVSGGLGGVVPLLPTAAVAARLLERCHCRGRYPRQLVGLAARYVQPPAAGASCRDGPAAASRLGLTGGGGGGGWGWRRGGERQAANRPWRLPPVTRAQHCEVGGLARRGGGFVPTATPVDPVTAHLVCCGGRLVGGGACPRRWLVGIATLAVSLW